MSVANVRGNTNNISSGLSEANMKFNYPDKVLVSFGGYQSQGTVMAGQLNRRWDRRLRQHLPYEAVYLISFGEGRGCWYSEEQLQSSDLS